MADESWIGGLNITQFVDQQMAREKAAIQKNTKPVIDQLTSQQSIYTTQQNSFQQLAQLLPTYNATVTAFANSFNPTYQVAYSTPGVATAEVVGAVSPGLHSLNVTQLAQAQSVESGGSFSSSSSPLAVSETMNFSLGPVGSPLGSFGVNIASTDSLQSIAANINNTAKVNGYGITASVISTTMGHYQLIIGSSQSGSANQFQIAETPNVGSSTLQIATGAGQPGIILQTAQDAIFTLDTISYDQSSNNTTVAGMNLTVMNLGSTNINLSANYQTSNIVTAAQNMVASYNQIITLAEQTQLQSGGIDSNLNLLLTSLQNQINSVFGGTGPFAGLGLNQIGIEPSLTPQAIQVQLANNGGTSTAYLTGLMQVDASSDPTDTSSLTNALNNNMAAVQSMLFDSTNGIMALMQQNVLNPGTGSADLAINNPATGGLATVSAELASTTQQLATENQTVTDKINGLKMKYAQLEVTLESMQATSLLLTEQMKVLSNH